MAGKKISQLPIKNTPSISGVTAVVQEGITYSVSLNNILNLYNNSSTITNLQNTVSGHTNSINDINETISLSRFLFVELPTYQSMLSYPTPTLPTEFRILVDEDKHINNTCYKFYPSDGKRVWVTQIDDN